MCGIVGFIDRRLPGAQARVIVESMARRLAHRGPDDAGTWLDDRAGLAFGHRRLAVLDLSPEGHQPMVSACGRYVVVFNGEIYNVEQIRHALQRTGAAVHWRGHSDTEVLLAAVTHWGLRRALDEFVGMFAFAIWDREQQTLSLARDRMGEKPLYFGQSGSVFLFASELKGLRPHPAWGGDIDRDALLMFMRYGYIPVPFTIFRGIRKLAPGAMLTVRAAGDGDFRLDEVTYWSALDASLRGARNPFRGDKREALMQLENVLGDAVRLQAQADVPVGAFLSGGIDSSVVVSLMQAQAPGSVRTFSIGFEEQGFDEAPHAAAVARHLSTDHTQLYLTVRETLDALPRLPALFDEPFADPSQIALFLLAQLTRRHVTVALSGDGGDELFYGYRRFVDTRRFAGLTQVLPAFSRSGLAAALRCGAAATATGALRRAPMLCTVRNKLYKAAHLLSSRNSRELYWNVLMHWNHAEQVVLGGEPRSPALINTASMPEDFDDWMMYQDMVSFLPDDVLTKVDRTTMAVSLEARAPLLDHRVVEFAWTLPMSWKYRDGRGKWLLRQLLDQYVPRHLVDRPKAGFEVPIAEWLRTGLREWAEDLLAESKLRREGLLDVELIRRKWAEHLSGLRNWRYCLWDVLMFEAWLANQAEEPAPRTCASADFVPR